jgi:hypothetical protein
MAGVIVRLISTRVGESFLLPSPFDHSVKREDDLVSVFRGVLKQIGSRKIERMVLLCHAYASGGEFVVFMGSVTGKEGVRAADARATFGLLGGRFASSGRGIEIQACNVAQNQGSDPSKVPSVGSGAALCQAIADAAQTGVMAADRDQPGPCQEEYHLERFRNAKGLPEEKKVVDRVFDCKADVWTGQLWLFAPKGQGASQVPTP